VFPHNLTRHTNPKSGRMFWSHRLFGICRQFFGILRHCFGATSAGPSCWLMLARVSTTRLYAPAASDRYRKFSDGRQQKASTIDYLGQYWTYGCILSGSEGLPMRQIRLKIGRSTCNRSRIFSQSASLSRVGSSLEGSGMGVNASALEFDPPRPAASRWEKRHLGSGARS